MHANRRLRIAIDMDETIADSLKEHIRRYNSEFAEQITADDLHGKHLEEFVPLDRSDAVRSMIRDESFFECLSVIEDAQQVIRELAHEVFIGVLPRTTPGFPSPPTRWLRRHFPFIPACKVVFCGDKGIIDADYLIDDEARHFRSFRWNGILFSAPHNLLETAYQRLASWQDIRRKFVGLQTTDTPTKRNQLVSTSDQ